MMNALSPIYVALALFAASAGAKASEEKTVVEKQVPPAVHAAFKKAFPTAAELKYQEDSKDGKSVFEIEFKDQGKELEASYTPEGILIETEESIKTSELPKVIVEAVKAKYPKSVLKEAEKVIKPDGTVGGFEVDITEGNTVMELEMDSSGKILKSEVEKKG